MFASVWPYRVVRWALATVFVYAGGTKLTDIEAFAEDIGAFGLVYESALPSVAVGLPVVEIVAGIGLALDLWGSLALTCGLLVLFVAVVSYGLWLGLDIDCGCFGAGEFGVSAGLWPALSWDAVMVALCAYLYGWRWRRSIGPVKWWRLFAGDGYRAESVVDVRYR